MRKSFLEWLQDYAIHAGLVGLFEGMLTVVAFAGALSALLGTVAIRAGAMFAVAFGLLGLIAVLSFNRRELRNKDELHRSLLSYYCLVISERFNHSWKTTYWKDIVVISSNGDVRETITVRAVVECDTLDFFSVYMGPGWPQPERYRRRVRVNVRSLEVEGAGGTRRDTTWSWTAAGCLETIVHFGEPARRGSEISMRIELTWPAKCLPLMRRRAPEEFALTFIQPIDHLEYQIALPAGVDVYFDTVGLVRGRDDYDCAHAEMSTGCVEVKLIARGIAQNRRVGLRLDRKQ